MHVADLTLVLVSWELTGWKLSPESDQNSHQSVGDQDEQGNMIRNQCEGSSKGDCRDAGRNVGQNSWVNEEFVIAWGHWEQSVGLNDGLNEENATEFSKLVDET